MSTEIKYKNIFGSQLTFQQVQSLDDSYQQEQYVDGELKRIDFYDDGQISYGTYHLSQGEDLQTVLTEVQDIWEDGTFYINTQTVNGYIVKDWEVYKGLVKTFKGQTVYDNEGREIADQSLDINTLEVIRTTKYFYLGNLNRYQDDGSVQGFGTIVFDYNSPGLPAGEINVKVNLPGYEHRSYNISGEQNILLNPDLVGMFSWDDEPYYQSASPLIPS